jgi:hypothetical protein
MFTMHSATRLFPPLATGVIRVASAQWLVLMVTGTRVGQSR